MIVGTSGILNRYDYAKTDIGCSHWRHLYLTPNALYWIDALDKAMFKYSRGPEEVSLMKGMDSWFRTNVLNSLGRITDGMHSGMILSIGKYLLLILTTIGRLPTMKLLIVLSRS